MEGVLKKFEHLKIQLEEITSATNNFDDEKNRIGVGGFGKVYKAEVSHVEGRSMVAIKRLDRSHGQGEVEFMKEIDTLSRYKHENLISLLGFCYQGDEAIVVYELASRGSLDKYLNSPDLMWSKRIKICLDAAKGLRYLHDPRGTHQRVIHCDVKGGNILLDDHWNAKIADFGFSIMGPANELQSTIITLAAGTQGYIDPLYRMTNTLTKESDVYSFGVVLVEVFCGTLCHTYSNGSVRYNLVPTWKECYEQNKLNDIIFKDPAIQPLNQSALETFSDIAYRCLKESREDRPKMAEVVTELETAIENQEFESSCYELLQNSEFRAKWEAQSFYYKGTNKTAKPLLNYRSEVELMMLLSEGILLNGGKTWFSLNKRGEHSEMISIAECLGSEFKRKSSKYNSRFPKGTYHSSDGIFETSVKTQFLSPLTTYTVNLVFKFRFPYERRKFHHVHLKYKLQGETESSISYLAYKREDGWWIAELYQFTCDHKIVHLQILFDSLPNNVCIEAEGIEFRPLGKVEHKEDENQPISDSDANWEEKLPTNYEDIIKLSKTSIQRITKEEAYSIMCEGFFINDDYNKRIIWFYLDKNGKKCHMLAARELLTRYETPSSFYDLPESRFGEAFQHNQCLVNLRYEVQSQLVSSQTTYAIYLVYMLSKDQSGFEAPMKVKDWDSRDDRRYIYLVSPQIPVIKPKAGQNTHSPPSKLKKESLPHQRNDGWMEVQLLEFRSAMTIEMIRMDLQLITTADGDEKFRGLIIEGIEIRPV